MKTNRNFVALGVRYMQLMSFLLMSLTQPFLPYSSSLVAKESTKLEETKATYSKIIEELENLDDTQILGQDSNATKKINKRREYIFSYRLSVRDGVVLNETYHFVHAMTTPQRSNLERKNAKPQRCQITHQAETEKEFFKDNQEKILECVFIWGVKLEDITQTTNAKATSTTILSIPPTRLRIEFGNEWANITRIRR